MESREDFNFNVLKVAMYGSAQKIPDRSLIQEITAIYLDTFYNTDVEVNLPRKY